MVGERVFQNIDSSRIALLETFREFTENAVKDLLLPVRVQREGEKPPPRSAAVYLMALPDFTSAEKKAPYIIHQLVTAQDKQKPGEQIKAAALVRSVFAVYHEDGQEGALSLLGLMERLRIPLEKSVVIGKRFVLDLEKGPEILIYPDNKPPYYVGEMITNWQIPAVEREYRHA